MPSNPTWKTNETLAAGKGATVEEFVAMVGTDKLEIDVAPGARVVSRSMAGKLHTSTTPKIDASSRRLPSSSNP
jgi:hypothetical protein